jgi:hypothetical protein
VKASDNTGGQKVSSSRNAMDIAKSASKLVLKTVNEVSDVFPPLKSVASGLSIIFETLEVCDSLLPSEVYSKNLSNSWQETTAKLSKVCTHESASYGTLWILSAWILMKKDDVPILRRKCAFFNILVLKGIIVMPDVENSTLSVVF